MSRNTTPGVDKFALTENTRWMIARYDNTIKGMQKGASILLGFMSVELSFLAHEAKSNFNGGYLIGGLILATITFVGAINPTRIPKPSEVRA